jgi:hypothetical protein
MAIAPTEDKRAGHKAFRKGVARRVDSQPGAQCLPSLVEPGVDVVGILAEHTPDDNGQNGQRGVFPVQ